MAIRRKLHFIDEVSSNDKSWNDERRRRGIETKIFFTSDGHSIHIPMRPRPRKSLPLSYIRLPLQREQYSRQTFDKIYNPSRIHDLSVHCVPKHETSVRKEHLKEEFLEKNSSAEFRKNCALSQVNIGPSYLSSKPVLSKAIAGVILTIGIIVIIFFYI